MTFKLKNEMEIKIIRPFEGFEEILMLIKKLSDESNNFPFDSEDFGMDANNIENFVTYLNKGENSVFYGAYIGELLVGIAYLEGGRRARTFHNCNLGLGVLDEFSKQGIGTLLTKKLIDFAYGGEYIGKIDLQVKSDNRAAIHIYKKCGFQIEGKTTRALFIDGEFFDYINMGLIID